MPNLQSALHAAGAKPGQASEIDVSVERPLMMGRNIYRGKGADLFTPSGRGSESYAEPSAASEPGGAGRTIARKATRQESEPPL